MGISQLEAIAGFIEQHRTLVITTAGVAMLLLSLTSWWIRKAVKGKGAELTGKFLDAAAVGVAIALSGEGMWEVATEGLGFGWEKAILLFAFADLGMTRAARRARAKVKDGKHPGVYGVMVWAIALGGGGIAALNAPNLVEFLVRLGAPALVAGQWWVDLLDEMRQNNPDAGQESTVLWTPRRFLIWLGAIKPGKGDDLTEVFRQRHIDEMVRTARSLRGARYAWRKRQLAARLQRLGESLGETDVLAAVARYQRGATVQQTFFGEVLVPTHTDATQRADAPTADAAQPRDARRDAPATHDATHSPTHDATHTDAPATHRVDAASDAATRTASPAATQPTRRIDAGATRRGKTVLKVPADLDDADRDTRVRQAADAVEKGTHDLSQRAVALRYDITESSLRRELTRRKEARKRVNGHSFEPAAQ